MLKNFVKFNLKPKEEIIELLKEKNNIVIICCNMCYETLDSQEHISEQIVELSLKLSKNILSFLKLNFLCNSHSNKDKIINFLQKYQNIETISVASCGLGVQFIADIVEKEVITLTDSVQPFYISTASIIQHGITLENYNFCATCGQCFLNHTGGICPIVKCSKSLLNGPCGGAKNGKCEVDKTKDCGWEKIYQKLKNNSPKHVFFRNYNVLNYEQYAENLNLNVDIRTKDFFGGLNLIDNKDLTENLAIEDFPQTQIYYLFLSQHIGKPSIPIVKEGEHVKIFQKIAQSDGLISSNLHSPVSGKILKIKEVVHPKLKKLMPAIIIENDFKNEFYSNVKFYPNWKNFSKQQILHIITEAGIVGLGGAMFPTQVKLSSNKPIDTLVINGCESEPYINADNRIMIEHTKEVFEGIEIIKYLIEPKKIVFVVENNKTEAIKSLNQFKPQDVEIIVLKTKYPYGAEKILIKRLFGIDIPYDKVPIDFGFLVQNVSTIFSIYNAVVKGIPLIERIVTISGVKELNKSYGNYKIKIGTPIKDIIKKCFKEEIFEENYTIKYSGLMTGTEIENFDTAIIKGCNGILAVEKLIEVNYNNKCIKCGRCIDVCPMELEPLNFVKCYQENKILESEKYVVKNCIECGCCQYVCPSKIPILEIIKKEKLILK